MKIVATWHGAAAQHLATAAACHGESNEKQRRRGSVKSGGMAAKTDMQSEENNIKQRQHANNSDEKKASRHAHIYAMPRARHREHLIVRLVRAAFALGTRISRLNDTHHQQRGAVATMQRRTYGVAHLARAAAYQTHRAARDSS